MLTLVLDNDGPDVRVANPDAIWMRDVDFASCTPRPRSTWSRTRPASPLAPVPVFVRRGDSDPEASALEVERALEVLLDGPRGRYDQPRHGDPGRDRAADFRYAEDVATVNLSRGSPGQGLRSAPGRPGRLDGEPPAPVHARAHPVEGRQVRTIGDEQFPTARAWQRRGMPLAAMCRSAPARVGRLGPVRAQRRDLDGHAKAGQPPKPLELDARGTKSAPTRSPDRHGLPGRQRRRAPALGDPGRPGVPRRGAVGQALTPSWSPDSKRIYVVARDETGARLLEVSRSTLSVRPLSLPRFPTACS